MKKYLTTAFMLFSIIATAETQLNIGGQISVELNEYTETDGNEYYSTNGTGNIFGTDDWKGSTMDNIDDTAEKFQATVDLNMEAIVNEDVKVYLSLESLTENFTGTTTGDEETSVQESSTVRDNEYLYLKELRVELDTEIAEFTITNDFNYSFNPRVLFKQLDDNDGEPIAYGEGIYAKGKTELVDVQAFLFQSSDLGSADDDDQADYESDYMVYGIDVEKEFNIAKVGFLAVNTHDKSTDVEGDSYDEDRDVQHYAVDAEFNPFELITVKGEYITAIYGDDVTEVDNYISNALSWYTTSYDVSTDEAKEDNSIYEGSVIIRPMLDVEITAGYKNVGEDYYAVLGNSHQMNYWFGDAEFDAHEGLGYEKGAYGSIAYYIPFIPIDVKNTITYEDFENTRSAVNDDEDTTTQEIEALFEMGDKEGFAVEASYRRNEQENGGTGSVDILNYVFNDYNANASYKMSIGASATNTFALDLNYYTGQDEILEQNFSNEKRLKASSITEYKVNEKLTAKGIYRFGMATENNDVIQDAVGTQHIVKAGFTYALAHDCTVDLFYKYDAYSLDREATAEDLENSVYKKEASHQWYDGAESWQHSGDTWDDWMQHVTPDYDGYITHELCAKLTVKF